MASLTTTEPGFNPGIMGLESVVPASMFAPARGCSDDDGAECFEDGDMLNGETADLGIDFSSKFALVSPNGEQYDLLLRQLRERMDEGCGETIYVVGVGSDGGDYGLNEGDMQASVATIKSMSEQIEADLILLRERAEAGGQVRDYLIRRRVGEADFLEVSRSKVCGTHFIRDQIMEPQTPGAGKRLVPGAVPVLFASNDYTIQPSRPSVWERRERPVEVKSVESIPIDVTMDHDYCTIPETAAAANV